MMRAATNFRHSSDAGKTIVSMDKRLDTQASAAPLTPAEIRSILTGVMLAMFLAALDQTIVATALPTMGRDLGDVAHLAWIVTIYLLASTAVTPLYGKLADIHGRRVTLLAGIVVFVIGSIACALAPSLWLLVVARFVQGLGGGGLIALAQTLVGDMVPPKERGRYQV
jgi:MFS family permease